jgi:hypothetical protein
VRSVGSVGGVWSVGGVGSVGSVWSVGGVGDVGSVGLGDFQVRGETCGALIATALVLTTRPLPVEGRACCMHRLGV